jgi:hypothetical protein
MKSFRLVLILVGCLLALSLASATTVIPMSVESLTAASSHVLEGTAVQVWSQWNPEHTIIHTYTKFRVERLLKGPAPDVVIVKQLGGRVGTIVQRVAGVRHWRPGEEAVLFLQPAEERDGTLVVTGLIQGNYRVMLAADGTRVVSNGVPDVSVYSAATKETTAFQGSRMRVEDLESRVQKAVQR